MCVWVPPRPLTKYSHVVVLTNISPTTCFATKQASRRPGLSASGTPLAVSPLPSPGPGRSAVTPEADVSGVISAEEEIAFHTTTVSVLTTLSLMTLSLGAHNSLPPSCFATKQASRRPSLSASGTPLAVSPLPSPGPGRSAVTPEADVSGVISAEEEIAFHTTTVSVLTTLSLMTLSLGAHNSLPPSCFATKQASRRPSLSASGTPLAVSPLPSPGPGRSAVTPEADVSGVISAEEEIAFHRQRLRRSQSLSMCGLQAACCLRWCTLFAEPGL